MAMMRQLNRLKPVAVARLKATGYYADGAGLYLQISASGTKSWIFRYTIAGRAREMGLGPLRSVSLVQARAKADDQRRLLLAKIDPIEARDDRSAQIALEKARTITFSAAAERYVAAHKAGWKNAKHAAQWTNTLETYTSTAIGSLSVQDVDTAAVLRALEPIWSAKAETATRVRARVEAVLSWASVRGYRTGDNPARWRGHLEKLLPAFRKKSRVKHHAALPYAEVGDFLAQLKTRQGTAARALEFTILTWVRTGELIGARSPEFDLDRSVWTIPASRMKAGVEHRVPLSPRAVEIMRSQLELGEEYVFPGLRQKQPLSNMAMLTLLKRMGRSDITVHGFRSTARDWAAEQTAYPNHVVEMALAHTVQGVEGAYRRGDLFDKRRQLMLAWASYCARASSGKVLKIRAS